MSTPCEQKDNILHIEKDVEKLIRYTGLDPMSNGDSLRGRIDRLSRIMLILGVATVCIVTTLVAVSTWAVKAGATKTMEAAREITMAAEAIKAARP